MSLCVYLIHVLLLLVISQWAKSAKKMSEGVRFNLALKICQKYTPTDCFFGDFAHRVIALSILQFF